MQTADNNSIVLEAKSLTRRFGGLVAVNNVSFAVRKYEIFGLITLMVQVKLHYSI